MRNDYYSPSDLGTQVSTSPKRKAIDAADEDEAEAEELLGPVPVQNKLKINDRIVKVNGEFVADYNACIEAVKQTQTILELVILRDPDAAEGKEWLRDRLYNHSKFLVLVCGDGADCRRAVFGGRHRLWHPRSCPRSTTPSGRTTRRCRRGCARARGAVRPSEGGPLDGHGGLAGGGECERMREM